jgi:predicted metal-dependent phosphoesterase TrpH
MALKQQDKINANRYAFTNMNPDNIFFEIPDYRNIAAAGLYPVDMHNHSTHSDGHAKVRTLVKNAAKKGFGISITDHNQISGVKEALQMKEYDTIIVPGIEISASDGPHILVYFFSMDEMDEYYKRVIAGKKQKSPSLAITLSTPEILSSLEDANCIIAAAHPYGYPLFNKGVMKCIEKEYLEPEIINDFDAMEVVCGGMTRELNLKAVQAAGKYGISMIGGSDSHLLSESGSVVTCISGDSYEEVLEEIAKGRTRIVGIEKSVLKKTISGSVVLTKYLRYAPSSMAIHYRQNAPRVRHYLSKKRKI